MKGKISIIIPVYNADSFLNKCLTSITNQTYKNLEIIIINDGSTDNSEAICKYYEKKDNRIIFINQKNEGVSSARNRGLEVATGDYIGFVDSDDYVSGDMYEKLLFALTSTNSNIAECGYVTTNSEYKEERYNVLTEGLVSGQIKCNYNFLLNINNTDFVTNKLYEKSILKNIRFEDYKISEDYLFNAKVFYHCHRKKTIEDCCYYYVRNENSATMKNFSHDEFDRVLAAKQALHFYEEENYPQANLSKIYILQAIIYVYITLLDVSVFKKKKYIPYLVQEFKVYYKDVKSDLHKIQNKKEISKIYLFKISPKLYTLIIKLNNMKKLFIDYRLPSWAR